MRGCEDPLYGCGAPAWFCQHRGVADRREFYKKVVFSGDIGNKNQPLIKDPTYTKEADYVVMESTYGDRLHPEVKTNYVEELAKVIQETLDAGGNLVIPSFAVGRTQEILYFIRKIKADNLVTGHGNFPVYVDSPMAVRATSIFRTIFPSALTMRQWNW